MNQLQKQVEQEIEEELIDELAEEQIEETEESEFEYLECEKRHVFLLLMFVGGFYGAYTYSIRGGVFCNAQTANFVLFAMALGSANFMKAVYYLVPDSAPFQITQITINVLCSMQYNTFRQARGIPMATTFCTNHVRQLGIHIVKALKHPENQAFSKRAWLHVGMLGVFVAGGVLSTFLCAVFSGRAIWFTLIPLGFIFIQLIYADLVKEKEVFDMTPKGH